MENKQNSDLFGKVTETTIREFIPWVTCYNPENDQDLKRVMLEIGIESETMLNNLDSKILVNNPGKEQFFAYKNDIPELLLISLIDYSTSYVYSHSLYSK